ncbi:Predicted arabinose efflux permease, MFS family [Alteribacillus persepolensis]|uniref:Predicted arabinose efflux permease, MFS family n=1 Tax=Alteribacillus persepolensis TaxID=568899 RepID=A0A1G7Y7V2_9BACI|nr:MFS transporter [Alteribacillus persepolensis]SDG92531.1 Predicted arabinose efflux permease, MFS family [Alteribacillus persepolensis]
MSNPETSAKIWTKDFINLSVIQFIVFVIFYTLLTTLPLFVVNELGGSEVQSGLVVTAMLLSAILIRPFSGKLLERYGKRNMLVISLFAFAITTFAYMGITQFSLLLLLRFIHGISFGILTTATSAFAADILPSKRRGEGLGYFMMFMNLAVVAGPFLGLTLLQFLPFYYLFMCLNLIVLIGLLLVFTIKKPAIDIDGPKQPQDKQKLSFRDFIETKALPISTLSALVAIAYASILSFLSVYSESIGLAHLSNYFFLVFAVTMLVFRPFLGRLFDRRGPMIVILPCLFTFAVGLVLLSTAETGWIFLLSAALIGVGYGTILPCVLSLTVQDVPKHRNGHATATFFMLYDSGIAAGSYLLGIVVSHTGFQAMFSYSAILVLIMTAAFYWYLNRQKAMERSKTIQGESSRL